MTEDEQYMDRALQLAQKGEGKVSPNPLVGCVIVAGGEIIGEGWHRKFGQAHAEVNALDSVSEKSLLAESTMYVTLEPCNHHGKTPPCTSAILNAKIPRVMVAALDPDPRVAGTGIERLQQQGVLVEVGLKGRESRYLNRKFLVYQQLRRPYIILKWAETADGYIARSDFDSKWISNAYSRQIVHLWRDYSDVIMVGFNTVKQDDPSLTTRQVVGSNPERVIIDRENALSSDYRVFTDQKPTIVANEIVEKKEGPIEYWKLASQDFYAALFARLARRKTQSILIEGGSKTLNELIQLGLWDEVRRFRAPVSFGSGIPAPVISGGILEEKKEIMEDELEIFFSERMTSALKL